MFTFVLPLLSHRCVYAPLRFSYRKNLVVVGVEKKSWFGLKIAYLPPKWMAVSPGLLTKTFSFVAMKAAGNIPRCP